MLELALYVIGTFTHIVNWMSLYRECNESKAFYYNTSRRILKKIHNHFSKRPGILFFPQFPPIVLFNIDYELSFGNELLG